MKLRRSINLSTPMPQTVVDYGARLLNRRTIGRTTQDPCAEDFHWLSPYTVCGSDPINFVDRDGRRFTKESMSFVNDLRNACFSSFLKNMNSEYLRVLMELMFLYQSEQLYNIIISTDKNIGSTVYNLDSDAVTIYLPSEISHEDLLILLSHELKHCFQFDTGDICLAIDGNIISAPPIANDIFDEEYAYSRGALFGGKAITATEIKNSELYKNCLHSETSAYDCITTIPFYKERRVETTALMQYQLLAKRINRAFRIYNRTFKPQKK